MHVQQGRPGARLWAAAGAAWLRTAVRAWLRRTRLRSAAGRLRSAASRLLTLAELSEEGADVLDEQSAVLERREMSARRRIVPLDQVVAAPDPAIGRGHGD